MSARWGGRTSVLVGLAATTVAAAVGMVGARMLLRAQARSARSAIGKPLGERAFHPDRTYRRSRGRPITLVMLGDSIAAGLGATRPRHTLGVQLAKRLGRASGRAVRLVPCAEVGAESSWLRRQVAAIPADVEIDIAVVVVGGNDVTHRVRTADSVASLVEAVTTLRARGAQVVVGTCPDLGALVLVPQPLRGLARQAARRLAAAQREAVTAAGGRPVSLADVAGAGSVAEDLLALDRFHPSGLGYRRIACAMLPSLLATLDEPAPPATATTPGQERHPPTDATGCGASTRARCGPGR